VAVGLTDALTVTADYDRVLYSQLSDGIANVRYPAEPRASIDHYMLRDGDEGHLGVQYVIPFGAAAIALRGGGWYDPAHALRFLGDWKAEPFLFGGATHVWHYTGGFGVAIGEHFQMDAAADLSSAVKTGSVSTVVRF
jgi:hypothetical protein